MYELFYWAALTACSMTKFTLPEGYPLDDIEITDDDSRAALRALTRCVELYPQSPCVRELRRVKPLTYHVICGSYDREPK